MAGLNLGRALEGLSVGDAFGQQFFHILPHYAAERRLPPGTWPWTDDTAQAQAVVNTLLRCGGIDADVLADELVRAYLRDTSRGYGRGAHEVLRAIVAGTPWGNAARQLFGGQGSMGNGAAMRAAPIGAYLAHDIDLVAEHAARSAAPTHAHPEGAAGAVAVALGAAFASNGVRGAQLLWEVARGTPPGDLQRTLYIAAALPLSTAPTEAARVLGAGEKVLAADTVPYACWCAARHIDSFEDAMWATVSGGGDMDTTCAIAGGIVACASPVPYSWRASREPLL